MSNGDLDWSNDLPEGDDDGQILKSDEVTAKDRFKLAKTILLFAFIFFMLVTIGKIFLNPENFGISEVWDYYSVAFNSIISLIIGYYFRDQQLTNNT